MRLNQYITITRNSSSGSFSLPPEDMMLKILIVPHYIISLILSTISISLINFRHVNVEQLNVEQLNVEQLHVEQLNVEQLHVEQLNLIISCYVSLCKIYH